MEIEIGSPVILKDHKGFKKHGFFKGMKGHCNSLAVVDDHEYMMFQPDGVNRFYWVDSSRFELDEGRLND